MEDIDDHEQRAEIERLEESTAQMNETMQTSFAADMLNERDKITFALELAIAEVTRKKKRGTDEHGDVNESATDIQMQKQSKKSGYLGVAASIKLPFVIGEPEYEKHPFAGIVFMGTEFEQTEHYQNE